VCDRRFGQGDLVMAESRREARAPRRQRERAMPEESSAPKTGAAAGEALSPDGGGPPSASRFRIFIIDSGWNSTAHKVLIENFALIRNLQKDDPIYVLSQGQSIEFMRRHGSRIGRDPIIAVHDLAAMDKTNTADFHGFRLHLGLMHTPKQALQALQSFTRFL